MTSIPALENTSAATLARMVIAFAFFIISATCGVLSTLLHWEIMEKVNARLPASEQFQPLWWGPFKRMSLNKEYRRLFPDGKDLTRIYRLAAIMFASLVGLLIILRSAF